MKGRERLPEDYLPKSREIADAVANTPEARIMYKAAGLRFLGHLFWFFLGSAVAYFVFSVILIERDTPVSSLPPKDAANYVVSLERLFKGVQSEALRNKVRLQEQANRIEKLMERIRESQQEITQLKATAKANDDRADQAESELSVASGKIEGYVQESKQFQEAKRNLGRTLENLSDAQVALIELCEKRVNRRSEYCKGIRELKSRP